MSHISEGDLHAWLDGALPEDSAELAAFRQHAESCPDCALRLEEARSLREEAEGILAGATPREEVPPFAELLRRGPGDDRTPDVRAIDSGRLRRGWFSAQRLGWAASLMLALGAGWIGRAVLVERGWTDPFTEGPVPAATPALESEVPQEDPADYFARDSEDSDVAEQLGDEAGRLDRLEEEKEVAKKPDVEADVEAQESQKQEGLVSGERRQREQTESAQAEGAVDDADEALPSRAAGLAQAEPEEKDGAALAGGTDAPGAPVARKNLDAVSIQAPLDAWHAVPPPRAETRARTAAGCYRLEYSWSPGIAYLPGWIELTSMTAEARAPGPALEILLPDRVAGRFREAIWASVGPDSVWVRLVTSGEQDLFTIRAERIGSDWEGEGRVLSPAAPVSTGQTRGAVRLIEIPCQPT